MQCCVDGGQPTSGTLSLFSYSLCLKLVCRYLNTAKSIGIPYRDVYMFPCPTCSASASSQMSQLVTYLNANCASAFSGRVWLYYSSSLPTNKAFYDELVGACATNHVNYGVYSSSSQLPAIFGSTIYSYAPTVLVSKLL